MSFITLPKATRGFWNVGTGEGVSIVEGMEATLEELATMSVELLELNQMEISIEILDQITGEIDD